ncbi:arsenic resistance N-acetyltransferase ArsN2 [Haloarchaeobius sp. DFWS5]|uniref:arsenic resistance N-acetyltransferase ArsN2 n=1 Tax=Haloarchaeobius sp. DFWS5 TaxID=3446114 RepID=UPI003EBB12AF
MNSVTLTLRIAAAEELSYLESLLDENGLPSADVRSSDGRFYVGYDDEERVGGGGIEVYGTDGLLRSVVVAASKRECGYGTALCDELESTAADTGVETLYLLTTTAEQFFDDRGYERIDRDAAPSSLQETTEFDSLCPSSAVCMRRSLP